VIAAKGFEKDTYFSMGAVDIRGPSKLEGTVHVNVQLIRKFMANYFFHPAEFAPVPAVLDDREDGFVFRQGPAKGLGAIRFHDFAPVFAENDRLANVAAFRRQIALFKEMLAQAGPDKQQDLDPSFSLPLGEMFSIVVYGQLILEQAGLQRLEPGIVNQIFDFMVRDFARFALQIYGMPAAREDQRGFCREIMLIRSVPAAEEAERIWKECVLPLNGEYRMNE
jgi:acyl-CoA dehydrogenase